jgi:hypothetical protein
MAYQNLFNLLSEQYNLNLLESELQEIIRAVHKGDNEAKGVVEDVKKEIKQCLDIPMEDFRQWSSVSKEDLEQNIIESNRRIKQLKDMFAAHAMQSLILKGDTSIEFICKKAYQYAEEMIKQRNNINI